MKLSRRQLMMATGLGAVATGIALKPSDQGAPHNAYFLAVSQALAKAGLAQPTLIIDQQALDHNIQQVKQATAVHKLPVRLVVKSLPSLDLLNYLSQQLNSQRFMVFNLPMLTTVTQAYPQGDFLLGKPLTALAVQEWLRVESNRAALPHIQWLMDSPQRLIEYSEVAKQFNVQLRVSLEIDVGLHRGGFVDVGELKQVVQTIKSNPQLQLAGLMGYEAHVGKLPTILNMQQKAWDHFKNTYQQAISILTEAGYEPQKLTLNAGGSPTYTLHAKGTVANEVAVGTAFVQPCDFDLATLNQHKAACFIATPVLKALNPALIPAIEWADGLRRWWDVNNQQGYFIHGGNWLAKPVSPQGLALSGLYGRSSNQELWLGSSNQHLQVNDYVFFRPQQSEAVFLQFGDIVVFDNQQKQISQRWQVFSMSA
ncbi:MAG TPA: alanine racemase [Agitococcus sp.]|nr:alanine racemase [Agitococcus sp.]